jgi:hypothetical protein
MSSEMFIGSRKARKRTSHAVEVSNADIIVQLSTPLALEADRASQPPT